MSSLFRFIVLITLGTAATQAGQAVAIRPRLLVGDEFRLEVTRVREDSARPQSNYTGRTPVDVRVVSATAEGFVITWRPGATTLEGAAASPDPTLSLASKALGNLEFRVALNADGEYVRLENEAEITPKLEAARDTAIRLATGGVSGAQQEKADALMRQILSPSVLITMATRDVQTYVAMHGLELAVGDTLEVPLEQPNPFGGAALPAVFRARMESATAESATVTMTTTVDATALARATLALFEQAAGKPSPEELARVRLQITDDGTYVFDRKVGLMREVAIRRAASVAGVTRTDRWVIRLVTPPKSRVHGSRFTVLVHGFTVPVHPVRAFWVHG